MKKLVLLLMITLAWGTLAVHAGEKLISFEQLPKQAQEFANTYFAPDDPLYRISYIIYDAELFDSSYMIVYANGDGLEFNGDGEWKDFDCKHCVVPAELIPAPIQAYLFTHVPDQKVKKMEKNRRDYELELSNGLELKFDLEGNLLEVDD